MASTASFTARLNARGNRDLLVNGFKVGIVYLHEGKVTGAWLRDEEVKARYDARRQAWGTECRTLRDHLAIIRVAWEAQLADDRRLADAEAYAENAWLRAAEAPTNDDYGFEEYEMRMGRF